MPAGTVGLVERFQVMLQACGPAEACTAAAPNATPNMRGSCNEHCCLRPDLQDVIDAVLNEGADNLVVMAS